MFSAFKLALCNMFASLAQWQSTGLVNQRSRVQIPHEAALLGLHVWLAKLRIGRKFFFGSCKSQPD